VSCVREGGRCHLEQPSQRLVSADGRARHDRHQIAYVTSQHAKASVAAVRARCATLELARTTANVRPLERQSHRDSRSTVHRRHVAHTTTPFALVEEPHSC